MRAFLFLVFAFVSVNAQGTNDACQINPPECGKRPYGRNLNFTERIIGGRPAKIRDWGWQVVLQNNGRLSCGGSLINSEYVLTAAHCVSNTNPSVYSVVVGAHDRLNYLTTEPWAKRVNVKRVIRHEKYNSAQIKFDYALLQLAQPIRYSEEIVPLCIDNGSIDYTGATTWATGWGSIGSGGLPSLLYEVQMWVWSEQQAKARYGSMNPLVEVCAGPRLGTSVQLDTCQGDSGGPLAVLNPSDSKWYSLGITSWGYGCGGGGVYARTSYIVSDTDWLVQNIRKTCSN